jgi:hypothetical protein
MKKNKPIVEFIIRGYSDEESDLVINTLGEDKNILVLDDDAVKGTLFYKIPDDIFDEVEFIDNKVSILYLNVLNPAVYMFRDCYISEDTHALKTIDITLANKDLSHLLKRVKEYKRL